jgi:hypothetical protein
MPTTSVLTSGSQPNLAINQEVKMAINSNYQTHVPHASHNQSPTRASRVMDTIVKVALAALATGVALACLTTLPLESLVIGVAVTGVLLTPLFYIGARRPVFFSPVFEYRSVYDWFPSFGYRRTRPWPHRRDRSPRPYCNNGLALNRRRGVACLPPFGDSPAKFGQRPVRTQVNLQRRGDESRRERAHPQRVRQVSFGRGSRVTPGRR